MNRHIIQYEQTIQAALERLSNLGRDTTLIVVDKASILRGTLTDGDIRRGLLSGCSLSDKVIMISNKNPQYLYYGKHFDFKKFLELKSNGQYRILPLIEFQTKKVLEVINLNNQKSKLPVTAILMAGGEGKRLRPLTEKIPKPLIEVCGKEIINHNLDNLIKYGIKNYFISVRYLKEQIKTKLGDGSSKRISINYSEEDIPLGTAGCLSMVLKDVDDEHILLSNSDILTTLNYENMFKFHLENNADMTIASIQYDVPIPFAILEEKNGRILSLKEKPTISYYANAGIYFIKKDVAKKFIPRNQKYDATDLIEDMIKNRHIVMKYKIDGEWIDIGRHEELERAEKLLKNLNYE